MGQHKAGTFVGDYRDEMEVAYNMLMLFGDIGCAGNIGIHYEKLIEILDESDDPLIQTVQYSYNASIRGGHNILRVDNQHAHPGHRDSHHKHVFDITTGDQVAGSPFWLGSGHWPTLGEFVDEVATWYWSNREALAAPDEFAIPNAPSMRLTL